MLSLPVAAQVCAGAWLRRSEASGTGRRKEWSRPVDCIQMSPGWAQQFPPVIVPAPTERGTARDVYTSFQPVRTPYTRPSPADDLERRGRLYAGVARCPRVRIHRADLDPSEKASFKKAGRRRAAEPPVGSQHQKLAPA